MIGHMTCEMTCVDKPKYLFDLFSMQDYMDSCNLLFAFCMVYPLLLSTIPSELILGRDPPVENY